MIEKRHEKCFGKHHCWNQVQAQCVDEPLCLLKWGKNNIDKIRQKDPELAIFLEQFNKEVGEK